MKNKMIALTLALASATCLLSTLPAQDSNPGPGVPPGPNGRPGPGGPRLMHPILVTLDLNQNGIIEAEEIAKASESLKKLDKNGDGNITPDEHRPQRPAGGPGGPGGPGGRGGERPPRPQPE